MSDVLGPFLLLRGVENQSAIVLCPVCVFMSALVPRLCVPNVAVSVSASESVSISSVGVPCFTLKVCVLC